jgi:hypothetical protein
MGGVCLVQEEDLGLWLRRRLDGDERPDAAALEAHDELLKLGVHVFEHLGLLTEELSHLTNHVGDGQHVLGSVSGFLAGFLGHG